MFAKTTSNAVIEGAAVNVYASKGNPFLKEFKMLPLRGNGEGEVYKMRILPINYDEAKFGATDKFFVIVPQHYGVGKDAKEYAMCPEKAIGIKTLIKCPLCAEFKGIDDSPKRARITPYYYMNVILLSDNQYIDSKKVIRPIAKKNAETGKYIVYTIKVTKKQIFDIISNYYKNPQRKVKDMCDLVYGCAIQITATSKMVAGKDMPNFETKILEESRGDISKLIDEKDVKDLRLITEFVPTKTAVHNMMEGMSVSDAMEVSGMVHVMSGKQIGGATHTTSVKPAVTDDIVGTELMPDELEGESDFMNELPAEDVPAMETAKKGDDELPPPPDEGDLPV